MMDFLKELRIPEGLPEGVVGLLPWSDGQVLELCSLFYHQFYNDHDPRWLILGINPGRFGGGNTGVPFTDPVRLHDDCGIPNDLAKRTELSSDFVYRVIRAYGGPGRFYHDFFISSVSPIGFTQEGVNLNYYDRPDLQEVVAQQVSVWLEQQLAFGIRREVCFCLGEGKNLEFLRKLNARKQFFSGIIGLPHPRFIMQYRRKQLQAYIERYVRELSAAGSHLSGAR